MVDGGKRSAGHEVTIVARECGFDRQLTYEQFVAVYLNVERLRIQGIMNMADAVKIGMGQARVPGDWIDLLTDDPAERAEWRQAEYRNEWHARNRRE